eukprot:2645223-Prymnesium_polylepis.1
MVGSGLRAELRSRAPEEPIRRARGAQPACETQALPGRGDTLFPRAAALRAHLHGVGVVPNASSSIVPLLGERCGRKECPGNAQTFCVSAFAHSVLHRAVRRKKGGDPNGVQAGARSTTLILTNPGAAASTHNPAGRRD